MQKYCPLWNCLRSKTSFPKFTAGNKIWKGLRSTFFPEPAMKLIRMCICENCKMYLSGLRSTFFPEPAMKLIRIYICPNCTIYLSGLNTFPRACYEIDTLACILFGLSPDQIYQVSFLQYLAISCNTDKTYQVSRNNEADPPFLPFSLQMQDHLAELSAEQQFANFELVFKCNCIQDFPSVSWCQI